MARGCDPRHAECYAGSRHARHQTSIRAMKASGSSAYSRRPERGRGALQLGAPVVDRIDTAHRGPAGFGECVGAIARCRREHRAGRDRRRAARDSTCASSASGLEPPRGHAGVRIRRWYQRSLTRLRHSCSALDSSDRRPRPSSSRHRAGSCAAARTRSRPSRRRPPASRGPDRRRPRCARRRAGRRPVAKLAVGVTRRAEAVPGTAPRRRRRTAPELDERVERRRDAPGRLASVASRRAVSRKSVFSRR